MDVKGGVDALVLVAEFEQDVGLGQLAGLADHGDGRSGFNPLADALEQFARVAVEGGQVAIVLHRPRR